LALFVNGDDDCVQGRVHVEPTTSSTFSANSGLLERLKMRRRRGWRRCMSHKRWTARSEMPTALAIAWHGFIRRLGAHQRQDFGGERRTAGLARLVAQETLSRPLALPPAPHHRSADAGPARHFQDRQTFRRKEKDPRTLNTFEPMTVIFAMASKRSRSSERRMTFTVWAMNPDSHTPMRL
jgi:hypothetical protein